jgi:hypothetical protein
VLANLPRTRPQRSSARRDAARRAAGSAVGNATALARTPRSVAPAKTQPAQPTAASTPAHKPRTAATAKAQPNPAPKPAAAKQAPAKAQPSPAPKPAATKKAPAKAKPKVTSRAAAKTAAKRAQDPVPRQGFETEGDPVSGPVQPPGSVDLLSSAAELAGELTKSGFSSGGRLLKDFLSRLPLN